MRPLHGRDNQIWSVVNSVTVGKPFAKLMHVLTNQSEIMTTFNFAATLFLFNVFSKMWLQKTVTRVDPG